MRYAVMSDIHGNVEALGAVLADMDAQRIEEVVCLGDLVGYGADPNECVEATRGAVKAVVAGNHDWATVGKLGLEYFNDAARKAAGWTEGVLTEENRRYLLDLPLTAVVGEEILLVHSSPTSPDQWMYVFHPGQAARDFGAFTQGICFIGHTHQPAVFTDSGGFHLGESLADFKLGVGTRYIVNVGSVGQPRDGNPKAAYCVYDSEAQSLRIRRVEYDVARSSMKIVQSKLPKSLAERLPLGL
jgi:diadenosine tetraphosphatase ApaH/serine/threonine PP2A family protein phosphatase